MNDNTEVVLSLDLPVIETDLPSVNHVSTFEPEKDKTSPSSFDVSNLPGFSKEVLVFHGKKLSLCARLLGYNNKIELTPLELSFSKLEGPGATVMLNVPYKVLSNCISLTENGTGELIVLKFVTTDGLIYSVELPKSSFSSATNLQPNCDIISEFSGEISQALTTYALSAEDFLIALKSGDIFRIDGFKSRTVLSASSIGGMLSKLWKREDTVPGHPEFSMSAVTSMLKIDDSNLLTYSVDSSIRLWNLHNNKCIKQVALDLPLKLRPSQNLVKLGNNIIIAHSSGISTYNERLEELSTVHFPSDVHDWFVVNTLATKYGLVVALKINLSAKILLYSDESWSEISSYDFGPDLLLDIPSELTTLTSRVMSYDTSIIKTCLMQLNTGDKDVISVLSSAEIPAYISNLFYGDKEQLKWIKFENMCREVHFMSREILQLASMPDGIFWAINANSATVITIPDLKNRQTKTDLLNDVVSNLLNEVPDFVLSEVSAALLSRSMALGRLSDTCSILRPYLDQTKLNEIGRTYGSRIVDDIQEHCILFGPDVSHRFNPSKLSSDPVQVNGAQRPSTLGRITTSKIIHTYAANHERQFLLVSILAVIAIVEGWGDSNKCSNELLCAINHLRLFSVYTSYGPDALTEVDLDIHDCGPVLARKVLGRFDVFEALTRLLVIKLDSENEAVSNLGKFNKIAEKLEPSSRLTFMHAIATLNAKEEIQSEILLRKVSIAKPWIDCLGPEPNTLDEWYARLAKYADAHGSKIAALRLVKIAAMLTPTPLPNDRNEDDYKQLLEIWFNRSLEAQEIDQAYIALTRRFTSRSEIALEQEWIERLLIAVCAISFNEARSLVTKFAFIGLSNSLNAVLQKKQSFASIPAYKLLYFYCISRDDFIGAAAAVYSQLEKSNTLIELKIEIYTVCLNALELVSEKDRYICCNSRIVTYDEIKRELAQLESSI